MGALKSPVSSEEDLDLVRRVDRVEKRVLEQGGPMVGSAIGLGSILGSFVGPEGTAIGAVLGVIAGYLVPRITQR